VLLTLSNASPKGLLLREGGDNAKAVDLGVGKEGIGEGYEIKVG
jgi:hypothetical protein